MGIEFEAVLEDVETLNEWALEGRLDITKLSFPAFFRSAETYILLNAGSALGKGVGPLLVSRQNIPYTTEQVNAMQVALPGVNTTANLLFSFAYPQAVKKIYARFDTIEDYVLHSTDPTLGVIIHENRFTYQQKGLFKVTDLGEVWESKMKVPIPLGGIAIKRNTERAVSLKAEQLIRNSLQYAFQHYPAITGYVKEHAQAMQEEVMRKHIELYVNEYSLNLGEAGQQAIRTLATVFGSNQQPPVAEITSAMFLS